MSALLLEVDGDRVMMAGNPNYEHAPQVTGSLPLDAAESEAQHSTALSEGQHGRLAMTASCDGVGSYAQGHHTPAALGTSPILQQYRQDPNMYLQGYGSRAEGSHALANSEFDFFSAPDWTYDQTGSSICRHRNSHMEPVYDQATGSWLYASTQQEHLPDAQDNFNDGRDLVDREGNQQMNTLPAESLLPGSGDSAGMPTREADNPFIPQVLHRQPNRRSRLDGYTDGLVHQLGTPIHNNQASAGFDDGPSMGAPFVGSKGSRSATRGENWSPNHSQAHGNLLGHNTGRKVDGLPSSGFQCVVRAGTPIVVDPEVSDSRSK